MEGRSTAAGTMWSGPLEPLPDADEISLPDFTGPFHSFGDRVSLPDSPAHTFGGPTHLQDSALSNRGFHETSQTDPLPDPRARWDSEEWGSDQAEIESHGSAVRLAQAKVVLLGSVAAGKTSLLNALRYGEPRLAPQGPDGRTIGIEVHSVSLRQDVTLWFYDFGGHNTYHFSQQLFLSQRAIYLLTVDISNYDPLRFEGTLCHWYNILTARLVAPVICVLATHIDECPDKELMARHCEDMYSKIIQMENINRLKLQKEMQSLKEEIKCDSVSDVHKFQPKTLRQPMQRLALLMKNRPRIFRSVCCLSSKTYEGINQFRENLVSIVLDNASLFPQNDVPKPWLSLSDIIITKKEDVPFVTMSEFVTMAEELDVGLEDVGKALGYLQSIGLVLHYEDYRKNSELSKYVFVNPNLLLAIFGLVFNHNYFMDETRFVWKHKAILRLPHPDFVSLRKNLRERGVIGEKLLRCFWDAMGLTDDVYRAILPLLEKFDLCYEIRVKAGDGLTDGRHFLFPYLLNKSKPPEIAFLWSDDILDNFMQCGVELCFTSKGLPFGFLEKVLIRAHTYVDHCLSWKEGMVAFCDEGQDLIRIEAKEDGENLAVLTLSARVRIDRKSMARHIILLLVAVTNRVLLHHYPGVVAYWYCQCAHCLNKMLAEKDTETVVDTFPADNIIYTSPAEARDFQCRNCLPGQFLSLEDVFPTENASKQPLKRLMSEPCCRALSKSAASLMKYMNYREVMNALLRKQLLDIHQAEAIGSKSNHEERSQQLLSYLPLCDQKAFAVLCDVLKEDADTVWIAEELQARASGKMPKGYNDDVGSIGGSSLQSGNFRGSLGSGSFTSSVSKYSYVSDRSSGGSLTRRPYSSGTGAKYMTASERIESFREPRQWYRAPTPSSRLAQSVENTSHIQTQPKPDDKEKIYPVETAQNDVHQARDRSKDTRQEPVPPRGSHQERVPLGRSHQETVPTGQSHRGPIPPRETHKVVIPPRQSHPEPILPRQSQQEPTPPREIPQVPIPPRATHQLPVPPIPPRETYQLPVPPIPPRETHQVPVPPVPPRESQVPVPSKEIHQVLISSIPPREQHREPIPPRDTHQVQGPAIPPRASHQVPIPPRETPQVPIPPRETHQVPIPPIETHQVPIPPREIHQVPISPIDTHQVQGPAIPPRKSHQVPTPPRETPQVRIPPRETPQAPIPPRQTPEVPIPPRETHQIPISPGEPPQIPIPPRETHQVQIPPRQPPQVPAPPRESHQESIHYRETGQTPVHPIEMQEVPIHSGQSQPTPNHQVPSKEAIHGHVEMPAKSSTEVKTQPVEEGQLQNETIVQERADFVSAEPANNAPANDPTQLSWHTSDAKDRISQQNDDILKKYNSEMYPGIRYVRDVDAPASTNDEPRQFINNLFDTVTVSAPRETERKAKTDMSSDITLAQTGAMPIIRKDQKQSPQIVENGESFLKLPSSETGGSHPSRTRDKRVMSTGDIPRQEGHSEEPRPNDMNRGFPASSAGAGQQSLLRKPRSASVVDLVGCADLGPKHVMTDCPPFELPSRSRPRSRSLSLNFKRSKSKSPKPKRKEECVTWASPYNWDSVASSGTWPHQSVSQTGRIPTRASETDLSKTDMPQNGMMRYMSQPVIRSSQSRDSQLSSQASFNPQPNRNSEHSGKGPWDANSKPPLNAAEVARYAAQQNARVPTRGAANKIPPPDQSSRTNTYPGPNYRHPTVGTVSHSSSYNEPSGYVRSVSQRRSTGQQPHFQHGQGGMQQAGHVSGQQLFPQRPPSMASSGRGSIALASDISDYAESFRTGRSHTGSDSDDATITSEVSELTLESFHTGRSQVPSVRTIRSEVTTASYHTGRSEALSEIPDDVTITSDISDLTGSFHSIPETGGQSKDKTSDTSADLTLVSEISNFTTDSFNTARSGAFSDKDDEHPFLANDTPNKQVTLASAVHDPTKVYRSEMNMMVGKEKHLKGSNFGSAGYNVSSSHAANQNYSRPIQEPDQTGMVTAHEIRSKEAKTIPLSKVYNIGFSTEGVKPESIPAVSAQQKDIPKDATKDKTTKTKEKRRKKRTSGESQSRNLLPYVGATVGSSDGKATKVHVNSDKMPKQKRQKHPKGRLEDSYNIEPADVSGSGVKSKESNMDAVRKEIVQQYIDSIPEGEMYQKYERGHYIETDIDSGLPTTVTMQHQERLGQEYRADSPRSLSGSDRSKPHAYITPYVHDQRKRTDHRGDHRVRPESGQCSRDLDVRGHGTDGRRTAAGDRQVAHDRPQPRVQFALHPDQIVEPERYHSAPVNRGAQQSHQSSTVPIIRKGKSNSASESAATRGEPRQEGQSRRNDNVRTGKRSSKHTTFYITGKENQEDLL